MIRAARGYACGTADAEALVLAEPLSLWGGVDPKTGQVIDHSHPDLGACVSGRILVMPGGRGSSSASSILAESLRLGTGPEGIVLAEADPILPVGALVAQMLYGLTCPIAICPIGGFATGDRLRVAVPQRGPATVEWQQGRTTP